MGNLIQLSLSDFLQRQGCPYCNSQDNRLLYPVVSKNFYSTPQGKIVLNKTIQHKRQLVKCLACGLIYHQLIPRKETMKKLYQNSSVLEKWDWDPLTRGFQSKFGFMLNINGKVQTLDIGCHTGGFLSLLPKKWEKHGIDFNAVSLNEAQKRIPEGIFQLGNVEDVDLSPNYFNIITMWDIAEHLYNVQSTFRKVCTSMAPGGYLILETGNWESLSARIFGRSWYYTNLLEHFVFFEPSTIQLILEENGLVVQQIRPTIHHRNKDKTWHRRLKSLLYIIASARGTVISPWLKTAEFFKKSGSPPNPVMYDHMFVVAKKVI